MLAAAPGSGADAAKASWASGAHATANAARKVRLHTMFAKIFLNVTPSANSLSVSKCSDLPCYLSSGVAIIIDKKNLRPPGAHGHKNGPPYRVVGKKFNKSDLLIG